MTFVRQLQLLICISIYKFVNCQQSRDIEHLQDVGNIIRAISGIDQLNELNSTWTTIDGEVELSPIPSKDLSKSVQQYQQSFEQLESLQQSQGVSQSSDTNFQFTNAPAPESEDEFFLGYSPIPLPTITVPTPTSINNNMLRPQRIPDYSPLPISSPLPFATTLNNTRTSGTFIFGDQVEKKAIQQEDQVIPPLASVSNQQIQQLMGLNNLLEFESAADTPLQQNQVSSPAGIVALPEVEEIPTLQLADIVGVSPPQPGVQQQNVNMIPATSQQNFQFVPANRNGNRSATTVQTPPIQAQSSPAPLWFMLGGNESAVKIPSSNEQVPSFLTSSFALTTAPAFTSNLPVTPPPFLQGAAVSGQGAGNINQGGINQNLGGQSINNQGGMVGNQGGGSNMQSQRGSLYSSPTCGRSDNPGPGTRCGCTNQVPCGSQACMQVYAMGTCEDPEVMGSSQEVPFGYCDVTCGRCECCPSVLQQSQNLNLTIWAEMLQIVMDATGGANVGMTRMGPTGSVVTSLDNPSKKATIFVPTNEAFEALLEQLDDTLQNFLTKIPMMQEIIQTHMVMSYSALTAEELWKGDLTFTLPTYLGGERSAYLNIEPGDSVENMIINSPGAAAQIQHPDINGCEASMHIIDQVLLPFEIESNTG